MFQFKTEHLKAFTELAKDAFSQIQCFSIYWNFDEPDSKDDYYLAIYNKIYPQFTTDLFREHLLRLKDEVILNLVGITDARFVENYKAYIDRQMADVREWAKTGDQQLQFWNSAAGLPPGKLIQDLSFNEYMEIVRCACEGFEDLPMTIEAAIVLLYKRFYDLANEARYYLEEIYSILEEDIRLKTLKQDPIEEARQILGESEDLAKLPKKTQKIAWQGTLKEFAELIVQLEKSGWIDLNHGALASTVQSLDCVFDFSATKRKEDSDTPNSLLQYLKPSERETAIFTKRYNPKFNLIAPNPKLPTK